MALIAALKVLGVGAGDEVIVPSHTYISSATCIELIGAHPVFVEVEPGYHTVALDAIKAAYTPNTKAVIAVHLYGQPVAREVFEWCGSQGLPVIEDAAQGHGASLDGDRVGSLAKSPPSPSSRAKTWPWVATAGPSSSTRQTCCTLFRCSLTTAVPANTRTIHWERTSVFLNFNAASDAFSFRHLDGWVQRRNAIAARYLDAFNGHPHVVSPMVREGAVMLGINSWSKLKIGTNSWPTWPDTRSPPASITPSRATFNPFLRHIRKPTTPACEGRPHFATDRVLAGVPPSRR